VASRAKVRRARAKGRLKLFEPPVPDIGKSVAIEVKKADEQWSLYILKDGTKLRIRPIVNFITRSKELYNQAGDPVYKFQTGLIVHAEVPKKLKRKIR